MPPLSLGISHPLHFHFPPSQGSRAARQQGSRAAEQQGCRAAAGRRVAGQHGSTAVGQQCSREVGRQSSRAAELLCRRAAGHSRRAAPPELTVVCYPRGDRHGGVCMYLPLSSPPRLGEAVPLRVEVGSTATVYLSSEQVPDCTLSTPQTQPTCDCISWSTGTCQSWSRWMNTYPGSVLCGRTHPWIQRSL
jgi:hypothetical protein